MNYPAQEGGPPSAGTWPAGDTRHLWPHLPNLDHHEQWDIILVFTGRVLTRFSCRVCPDGTLVSREVPKFTDIDKAGRYSSTANCLHTRSPSTVSRLLPGFHTDERLIIDWNRRPMLETAIQGRII
eukprot:4061673-Pyramimonas_sp.AAC.1